MAAQLIATKGRSRRGPSPWIPRATSSLPVPHQHVERRARDAIEQREELAHRRALAADLPERHRAAARSSAAAHLGPELTDGVGLLSDELFDALTLLDHRLRLALEQLGLVPQLLDQARVLERDRDLVGEA